MPPIERPEQQAIEREREQILCQLEDWLDVPMLVLSLAWLGLFVLELVQGLTPLLELVNTIIWGILTIEFGLRLLIAPRKLAYLTANWLVALSLLLPAVRLVRWLRVFRALQATRGLRLLQFLNRTSRSIYLLRANFARRGFGYAIVLTTIVTFAGAAGMYACEQDAPQPGFDRYSTALWWTAMLMTTLGADYSPQTAAGRLLYFGLAVYAFAVFGYVTATVATFFIDRDADDDTTAIVGARSVDALRDEIAALRAEIHSLKRDNL